MKRVLKRAVGVSPLWELANAFGGRGCAVLTYHRVGRNRHGFKHVGVDSFRAQMIWLQSHCSIIAHDEFRNACLRPAGRRPAVLVTFDDGYRDYHDVAYPVLEELRIPAINFIATGFVDRPDRAFWWDEVDVAAWQSARRSVEVFWRSGEQVTLDREGRDRLRMDIRRHIWSQPHARREATVQAFCDALDVPREALLGERQVMTWDEIRAVSRLTTVGAHTHNHPLLTQLEEPELHVEVATSRDRIAAEVRRPTAFAYPSGAVSGGVKRVVAEEGFEIAFAGTPGRNDHAADWFAIHRHNAPADAGHLAYVLSGLAARRQRSR